MQPWNLRLLFALSTLLFAFKGPDPQDEQTGFYLTTGRIFSPGEKVQVQLQSYNLRGNLSFTLFRIPDPVQFFLRQPDSHSLQVDSLNLSAYKKVKKWKTWIQKRERWWNYQDVLLDIDSPGVYLVEGSVGGKYAYTVVSITRYAMILKRSPKSLLAFVVDKESGNRLSNFPLTVCRQGKIIAQGKTSDGVFHLQMKSRGNFQFIDAAALEESLGSSDLLVMGAKDGSFVLSNPYYSSSWWNPKNAVYLYTERPVYRPGQDVFFKGILRSRGDRGFSTPSRTLVQFTVRDSRNNEVYRDTLFTNEFGSFWRKFPLGDEPPLGTYTMFAAANGESAASTFEVQEYKKPEYEVTVSFAKDNFSRGELLKAVVQARYYFGSPVSGANVEYSVLRSPYWRPWWRGTLYEWYYEDQSDYYRPYRSETIHTGRGKLDADGRLEVEFLTDRASTADYVYEVRANVTDASRRMVAGAQSVVVSRGLFTVSVHADKYLYKPKETVFLQVNISDFSGGGVRSDISASVVRQWYERERVWRSGEEVVDYQHRQADAVVITGRTGSDGRGTITFQPAETGYYTFTVTGIDSLDNPVSELLSVYVSDESSPWWGWNRSSAFQVIADKASYSVGDEIHALVIAPYPNLDVLVGIEAEDLLEYRVVHFEGSSAMLTFDVRRSFAPNVYLSVTSVLNDNFYHQRERIVVPPKEKFLQVDVVPDKEKYRPGEEGILTVAVKTPDGKPVPLAEMSLALVDESIYAIAPDKTSPIQSFFYRTRHDAVQTTSSQYHYMYAVAKSSRAAGQDAAMPEGVVMEENSEFQRGRMEYKDLDDFVEAVVRREFKDLVLWEPSILTDASGRATVRFRYPENLTTWRATVRVITKSTEVGSTTSKTITRKDLLVRIETPRFFMEHDSLVVRTTVHNYLGEDKRTKLTFSASGLEVAKTDTVISVPRNGEGHVDWQVSPAGAGEAVVTVRALTNEESDAMEVRVPVLPHGLQVAEAQVVDINDFSGTEQLSFLIPEDANLTTAGVFIHYSPSLASSILSALDDLIGYPYGCVEQTMSRFLPTVVVANTLQDLSVPMDPVRLAELPKMVERGLSRLASMQHSDGGWGWWKEDETNPFMTAYVIYGLSLAKRAHYSFDDGMFQRGVSSLKGQLERDKMLDPTTRAYMLYTLAFASDRERVLERHFFQRQLASLPRGDMNVYAKSLVALASYSQHDLTTARSLAGEIESAAHSTGTAAFWAGKSWHYNWQDDNVETTAFALKALINLKEDSDLISKGVHWLLGQKQGVSWTNTRQTAIVIFSLVDYLKNSRELEPNYTVQVFLNGEKAYEGRVTKNDLFVKEPGVSLESRLLRSGENRVSISKQGPGKLYLSSRILYYSSEENIAPRSAGFQVERQYYRLVQRRYGNEILYDKVPLHGPLRSGDEVYVEVKVRSDGNYEYFMLEDPLAAGVEVVLDTRGYRIINPNDPSRYETIASQFSWANRENRDEKVSFFASRLPAGEHRFSYIFRAQIPGLYHVMPAVGALMYYDEVRGNSEELRLRIAD